MTSSPRRRYTCSGDRQRTLFFGFNDSEEHRLHFLAVAEGVSPKVAQETFVTELFRSNGETFNSALLIGSPPNEINSRFPYSTLVDHFLAVAERAVEFGDSWNEVLEFIATSLKRSTEVEFDVSRAEGRRKALEATLRPSCFDPSA
jgi:hypothetical protein